MSERRCFICLHKECVPPKRVFLGKDDPTPRCEFHGPMVRQPNRAYGGTKKVRR